MSTFNEKTPEREKIVFLRDFALNHSWTGISLSTEKRGIEKFHEKKLSSFKQKLGQMTPWLSEVLSAKKVTEKYPRQKFTGSRFQMVPNAFQG